MHDLELALMIARRDDEEVKVMDFPLVLKETGKNWFQGLIVDR